METHSHDLHKAPGHGWKHYLFEFFMLFLAVLLGFFAENMREQHAEAERAGQLAKSLYEELKADSVVMQTTMQNRWRRDSALNYLKNFYTDSSLADCSKSFAINFFYVYATSSISVFEPNDAILQQLKNSGSLRYFKSMELQKLVDNLSVRVNYVRARNQIEWTFYNEHLLPFIQSHNDQKIFDLFGRDTSRWILDVMRQYEKNNEPITFHFQKPGTFDKVEAVNSLGFYQIITRSNSRKAYPDYMSLNHQLQDALRKEYDLK